MSEVERAALGAAPPRVAVVPNGVAIARPRPAPAVAADAPPTLLFTGTMTHPPNDEGVRWFAERDLARDPRRARPERG